MNDDQVQAKQWWNAQPHMKCVQYCRTRTILKQLTWAMNDEEEAEEGSFW